MPQHLGIHNEHLTQARKLLTAKGRKTARSFLFEGSTLLQEALASPIEILAVYASEAACQREPLLKDVPADRLFLVEEKTITRLTTLQTPSGIVSMAKFQPESAENMLRINGPLALLAGLNDPGNVGTLIRSAEALGIRGVLILDGGADPYQPKVVRAAMGALFRLPVATISLQTLHENIGSRPLIGLARHGSPIAEYLFPPQALLTIGHERQGLPARLPTVTATIAIPHHGPTESLNAAIAGSIVFYAMSCQKFHVKTLAEGRSA